MTNTHSASVDTTVDADAIAFSSRTHGQWIDGRAREAESDARLEVENPATAEVIAHVADGSAADVDRAVRSARTAFEDGRWSRIAGAARETVMRRLADLLEEHAEELATIDTLDNGMPIVQARGEVASSAAHLRYFAGWSSKLEGTTITPSSGTNAHVFTRNEPLGVIGAITAWNTPLDNVSWKAGAALATGNSLVLKPAEQTPLSALRFAELATEAGLPDGVLNVVTGRGQSAGAALSEHLDVDRVAFTGSTSTGRRIVSASVGNLKRVTLELGGKSPVIVMPDADLDRHGERIVAAVMKNSGQICTAGSRVYVHKAIAQEFLERAAAIAGALQVGDGLDPATQIGPLVSRAQLDRVLGFIDSGRSDGAAVVAGGRAADSAGYFIEPTIFERVNDRMQISREEIFGPVMSVLEFEDVDDAIARANDSSYGLGAGVFTTDLATAHTLADRLHVGTVWVNSYNYFDPAVPFGGVKQSGYGRELGRLSLEECTAEKTVWIALD